MSVNLLGYCFKASFIKSIVNLEAVNSFLVTLKQCSKKTLDFDSIWQDSSSIYVQLHHTSTLCSCYSGTYKLIKHSLELSILLSDFHCC